MRLTHERSSRYPHRSRRIGCRWYAHGYSSAYDSCPDHASARTGHDCVRARAGSAPAEPTLTDCGGGVYAGADTSCPFALNVEADYTGAGADYAYSPVTGQSYTMNCDGGAGALDTVTCTGGNNALVEFTG